MASEKTKEYLVREGFVVHLTDSQAFEGGEIVKLTPEQAEIHKGRIEPNTPPEPPTPPELPTDKK